MHKHLKVLAMLVACGVCLSSWFSEANPPRELTHKFPHKLNAERISTFIAQHKKWRILEGKLTIQYRFQDGFKGAVQFVQDLVDPADSMNHHPEISISYNRVTISLVTHDAGGITSLDLKLAEIIEAKYQAKHTTQKK